LIEIAIRLIAEPAVSDVRTSKQGIKRYKAEGGMVEGARRATGTMPAPGGSKQEKT